MECAFQIGCSGRGRFGGLKLEYLH